MNYLEQAKEIIKQIEIGYEILIDETISEPKQEVLRDIKEDFEVILDKITENSLMYFLTLSEITLEDFPDKEDFYDQVLTDFCNYKTKTNEDCTNHILVKLKYI